MLLKGHLLVDVHSEILNLVGLNDFFLAENGVIVKEDSITACDEKSFVWVERYLPLFVPVHDVVQVSL